MTEGRNIGQTIRFGVYLGGLGLAAALSATAWRVASAVESPECKVQRGAPIKISEISQYGVLSLADGRRLRLAGVDLKWSNALPKADHLEHLRGKHVRLGPVSKAGRTGDVAAHVFAEGGEWIQGALVSQGAARVRFYPDQVACAESLLKQERTAREAKRGLWANASNAVLLAEAIPADIRGFQIVEGRVARVARIGEQFFLNFGEDYRTDFTIRVAGQDLEAFEKAGLDLSSLEGQRVRARGIIRDRNGPQMDVSAPAQIERVEQPGKTRKRAKDV